jgi:hypothetical protein
LKLYGTHQLLVYAADDKVLGGSIHTIRKSKDTLITSSKDIGIEVNAEKTKHMVMSHGQHAGQNHNIKPSNKSFEMVEQFGYWGTTLTNRNCIRKKVKSRVKSRNACYDSMQNLLSSRFLTKNIQSKYTKL